MLVPANGVQLSGTSIPSSTVCIALSRCWRRQVKPATEGLTTMPRLPACFGPKRRWFPAGKIVFAAPTKPLVEQQMAAFRDKTGVPKVGWRLLQGFPDDAQLHTCTTVTTWQAPRR